MMYLLYSSTLLVQVGTLANFFNNLHCTVNSLGRQYLSTMLYEGRTMYYLYVHQVASGMALAKMTKLMLFEN